MTLFLLSPSPCPGTCCVSFSSVHTYHTAGVTDQAFVKSLDEEGPDPDACVSCIRQQTTPFVQLRRSSKELGIVWERMVVQQCHLWLTLTEMRDAAKSPLLDAPREP